jgi:hypothetical protein
MVMPPLDDMHFRRENFVRDLANWGYPKLADQAARELPESFDGVQAAAWCHKVGLSFTDLKSRMGGSP